MIATNANLRNWIARLSEVEMPIFGATVQAVISVSEKDSTNVADLTEVILRDSSMTARVLKLANSIYYNPGLQPISTISRAVTLVGFDTVRTMCLSIALVDTLVRDGNRKQLVQEMSRAIHAAIQARNIATRRHDKSPEEVFVAALLYHLGHMAFWCYGEEAAEKLQAMLQIPDINPEAAEVKVLGFKLRELTKGLAHAWKLDSMLADVLDESKRHSDRNQTILLSHKLAASAEKGWDSKPVIEIASQIAKLLDAPLDDVVPMIHEGAKDAVAVAVRYGATMIADIIPMPDAFQKEDHKPNEKPSPYNLPNPLLQLNILSEVMDIICTSQPQLKLLLEMLLEGIHRGIGTDNALITLISNDRSTLLPKYVLGNFRERMLSNFSLQLDPRKPNIFLTCITQKKPFMVDTKFVGNHPEAINKAVTNACGTSEFMIAPLLINGQVGGIIYADRAASKRPLDEDSFNGFRLFATTASTAIELMTLRKKK